jgi:hypothetical protein
MVGNVPMLEANQTRSKGHEPQQPMVGDVPMLETTAKPACAAATNLWNWGND